MKELGAKLEGLLRLRSIPFVVSDASSYRTGDTFLIDGGYSLL